MALEPTVATAELATSPDPFQPMMEGLGFVNKPSEPEAPVSEDPEVKEAPEVKAKPAPKASPAKSGDPLDELDEEDEEDSKAKLPIDDIDEEEDEPEEDPKGKKPKDQLIRERRIEELTKEIKNTYKPKLQEAEETLRQKEARIQELEGFQDELEQLRKTKAEYEAEMSVVRLEKTDVFRKAVSEPLDNIEKEARAIADAYGIDEGKLWQAFGATQEVERRKLLKEATSGLDIDPDDAFQLRKLISDAQPVFQKRDELYSNADQALKELEAQREGDGRAQAAERAKLRESATELVVDRINKKLPFLEEIINKSSENVKAMDITTLDPEKQAYYALAGESFPKIAKEIIALRKERDSLLDDLEGYKKATPRVSGSRQVEAPKRGGDPADIFARALHGG